MPAVSSFVSVLSLVGLVSVFSCLFRVGHAADPVNSLSATSITDTSITVIWTAPTATCTGNKVAASVGAGTTATALVTIPVATTYTFTGLTACTVYSINVICVNAGDSAVVKTDVTTLPAAPTGLAVVNVVNNNSQTASWTALVCANGPITGYRLYYAKGSLGTKVSLATSTTSLTVTGLICNTEYWYQVSTVSGIFESPLSAVVKLTTNPTPCSRASGVYSTRTVMMHVLALVCLTISGSLLLG